jgi:hypothetical protein
MIDEKTALALFIFALLPSAACATRISRQLLDEAGIPVLFEDLVGNPCEYRGRVVVLGGHMLEIQNHPGGSVLTRTSNTSGLAEQSRMSRLPSGSVLRHHE